MLKKYIVVRQFGEQIIVFSAVLDHSLVAGQMNVISAGFLGFDGVNPYCYGESTSLNIGSRTIEDTILAQVLFREENNEY